MKCKNHPDVKMKKLTGITVVDPLGEEYSWILLECLICKLLKRIEKVRYAGQCSSRSADTEET